MKRYLLDTNILLHALKKDSFWSKISAELEIDQAQNFISVVSIGELYALALRNNWGETRLARLQLLKDHFGILDINVEAILYRYAEIDAFSQGKLKDRPLNDSSRNMGKNDLWIASTASVFNLTLLTIDRDFNHLESEFIELKFLSFKDITNERQ